MRDQNSLREDEEQVSCESAGSSCWPMHHPRKYKAFLADCRWLLFVGATTLEWSLLFSMEQMFLTLMRAVARTIREVPSGATSPCDEVEPLDPYDAADLRSNGRTPCHYL